MRLSIFWNLMNDEFGETYASSLAQHHALGVLGDRTVAQALEAGESPRRVWLALCDAMDVPESRRLGVERRPATVTSLDWSAHPLVLAPMAGGPSTVALAVAAAEGGVVPFLAGAYLTPERLGADLAELRTLSPGPFGVNVFAPSPDSPSMQQDALAYAALLAPWAASAGVELGTPSYDDDHFVAKVDLLVEAAPALVSFAFGWPPAEVVGRLQAAGTQVWVTVNEPSEVEWAEALGVDGLVAQGWEAGGHRGGPVDTGAVQLDLLALVSEVARLTDLPIMGAGGVMTGADAAEVLRAGATAVALGTAFLDCPEAGTAPVHRHELTHRTRHHGDARLHRAQRPRPDHDVDRAVHRSRARGIPARAPRDGAPAGARQGDR